MWLGGVRKAIDKMIRTLSLPLYEVSLTGEEGIWKLVGH